eukprot:gene5268-5503_t
MAEDMVPETVMPGTADEEADYDFEDKEGVEQDLSGDGGCKKVIIHKGEGWEKPETGDEFDSSRDRGAPFTFKLGEGRVIKGWDTGVATMKKGELANLICRADYAYGAAGSPPTIPPDATLQFEVELLSWKSVKDITGDGGVIKTILSEGQGWQNPKDADEVVVTFSAHVKPAADAKRSAAEAGAPLVASSPEGGSTFFVGDAPCKGLAAALKSMKLHEKVVLLLSPHYAAGVADVPAGQQLEVELSLDELHQVSSPAPGVSKKTLVDPEGSYMKPNDGSAVKISVTTRSLDGSKVYEEQREVEYVTDDEQVPEGLELAVASMKAEEKAIITVTDPQMTKVPEGGVAGTGVPPGEGAVYEVTLESFTKAKEKWEMNNTEKLAAATARKEKGNAAYKAGSLARAARQYNAAVEAATSITERDMGPSSTGMDALEENDAAAAAAPSTARLMSQAREVKKACMNNWAAVELKRHNWAEAAKQASKVLDLDPSNVKALYRRAQARMALNELLEAELDVKAGLLKEPTNSDLLVLQRKLKALLRELNKKEAKLYGKMFAALGKGSSSHEHAAPAAANSHAADNGAEAAAKHDDSDAAPMQEDAATPAGAPVVEAAA